MTRNLDFSPRNPVYQQITATISQLEEALEPGRRADLLLKLGALAAVDDRISNKQADALVSALKKSGLLLYNTELSNRDYKPAEVDGARSAIESDGKLQHLAVIALSRFAEQTLSTGDQFELLGSLLNRAHQTGWKLGIRGSAPGYESTGIRLIPIQAAEQHEQSVFERRTTLAQKLADQQIFPDSQVSDLAELQDRGSFSAERSYDYLILYEHQKKLTAEIPPLQRFALLQEVLCLGYAIGMRDRIRSDRRQDLEWTELHPRINLD